MIGRHLLLCVVALVLQIATLFVPRSVESLDGLKAHWLGYPVRFATQDLSGLDPPTFPRRYALVSPWEYPVRFRLGRAMLAFGSILAVLEIAVGIVRRRE